MAATQDADQTHEFDPAALPLQVTLHNATVILSSFLLATIVSFLFFRLYRLSVYSWFLPRPLRNLLRVIIAEPHLASLLRLVSPAIRLIFPFFMIYAVSRYWMGSESPTEQDPISFNGIATMTMRDGSMSTVMLSDEDALSTFLVSSLGEVASATWKIDLQPRSSPVTPTLV